MAFNGNNNIYRGCNPFNLSKSLIHRETGL